MKGTGLGNMDLRMAKMVCLQGTQSYGNLHHTYTYTEISYPSLTKSGIISYQKFGHSKYDVLETSKELTDIHQVCCGFFPLWRKSSVAYEKMYRRHV